MSDIVTCEDKVCAYENCERPATSVAVGRSRRRDEGHPNVDAYCEAHAESVVYEGNPEYTVSCPNCGCGFGVN